MIMLESEGINGNYYSEEMDFGGEYSRTSTQKLAPKDPFYYHTPLFNPGEKHSVEHTTRLVILFRVEQGLFWVPKSLLNDARQSNPLVHKSFERVYLEEK